MRVETGGLIILVTGRSFCFSLVWMYPTMSKSDVGYSYLIFLNSTLSPSILLFNAQKMTYSRMKLLPVFFPALLQGLLSSNRGMVSHRCILFAQQGMCIISCAHCSDITKSVCSVRSFQVLFLTTNCILYAIELMQSCNDSTCFFYLGFLHLF